MDYRAIARRMLLEKIYDNMSDQEKRTFVQLTMMNADAHEIKAALDAQRSQLDRIEKKQDWKVDFLSDIAANLTTDGMIWLFSRLFKRL